MTKIIEINVADNQEFFEKYNQEQISRELIEYIIRRAQFVDKNEDIKIIIKNKSLKNNQNINMLYESFQNEYNNSINKHFRNNNLQFVLL